ncbi:MAG: ABC transporter permease subunit [Pseudomonadota bacterium]
MLSKVATYVRDRWISIVTLILLLVIWEVAGHLSPTSVLHNSPIVPSWGFVFGPALLGMSDYWTFDVLAPVPMRGGEQTLLGATLAIAYHSAMTLYRLLLGFFCGTVAGILLGLAFSWSSFLRRLASTPLHILRMFPLLAMVPLFQFWFGANTTSAVAFVAYGVGVVYFAATINAVSNVPTRYIEYARTLGASRLRVYALVILPAIVPELCSSVLLTLGLAWSAVIGAEYIGLDSGMGRVIIYAQYFTNTGRMTLATLFIILYAGVSFLIFKRLAARILRWMPSTAFGAERDA